MENRSLSYTEYRCQYHVVFIPKYWKKVLYGQMSDYSDAPEAPVRIVGKCQQHLWKNARAMLEHVLIDESFDDAKYDEMYETISFPII
mgnify:CR=1 FL=1